MDRKELREIIVGLLKRINTIEEVKIEYKFDGYNTAELTVVDVLGNKFAVTVQNL